MKGDSFPSIGTCVLGLSIPGDRATKQEISL